MPPTAVITRPTILVGGIPTANPYVFAGLTVNQFSAFDSTPGAGANDIVWCDWDWGDGTTTFGLHADKTFANPGTYPIKLTVHNDLGATAQVTINYPVVQFVGAVYYVAAPGSGGNDANSGLSPAAPLATLHAAIQKVAPSLGLPYRILANRGDSFSWDPAASGGADQPRGPCFFDAYGSGNLPVVTLASQIDYEIANTWGRSIQIRNWKLQFATRQDQTKAIQLWSDGSSIVDSIIDKVPVVTSGSFVTDFAMTGTTQSNSNYAGFYSSAGWTTSRGNIFFGNGASAVFHHQSYFSAFAYAQIRNNEYYLGGGVASFGQKTSGTSKAYISDNYLHDLASGFDAGANDDNTQGQDVIYERNRVKHCDITVTDGSGTSGMFGIYLNKGSRIRILNNTFAFCKQAGITISGYTSLGDGLGTDDVRVYFNTFYANNGNDFQINYDFHDPQFISNVKFKGNAIHRTVACDPANDKAFVYTYGTAHDANAALESDGNFFWSSAGDVGTTNAFAQNGTFRTYRTWQSSAGHDGNSNGGNHLDLVNPGLRDPASDDFTLLDGAAAIDVGPALAAAYSDFVRTLRPQGGGYDVGAYEYIGQNIFPTSIDRPTILV